VSQPCPSNDEACILDLVPCPSVPFGNTSPGGTCHPVANCGGFDGCQGKTCASDDDCDVSERCESGTCEGFVCTNIVPDCPLPCVTTQQPHQCDPVCVCDSCPTPPAPDAGSCDPSTCTGPFTCCGNECAYLATDTANCGACGNLCPFGDACVNNACQPASCFSNMACPPSDGGLSTCCGTQCCPGGTICCEVEMDVTMFVCADPAQGCPQGCPFCQ
jgi:hypothetical protein